LKYNQLGKTPIRISAVSYGCWELGGGPWEFTSDQQNIRSLHKALELGVNTFDTAEGYGNGHSEEIVGIALEGKRRDCVISTKVGRANLHPRDVRRSVEQSLKRLRTDYIDIYYIHWPSFEIPVEDTLSEFNRLKEEKLIRAIGVSNFSIEQLREAIRYAQIDVIQPEYSLLHRQIEREIVPFCLEHSIGIMSYSSIAKGILAGAFHLYGRTLKEDDFRKTRRLFLPEHLEAENELLHLMKEIADRKGAAVSQIAIRWLLEQPGVTSAIVGTQSEKHLVENAEAADLELTGEELRQLEEASSRALAKIDG
jgi:aryl-alcohol dehydrogenase-like predicted oxidoreductase